MIVSEEMVVRRADSQAGFYTPATGSQACGLSGTDERHIRKQALTTPVLPQYNGSCSMKTFTCIKVGGVFHFERSLKY